MASLLLIGLPLGERGIGEAQQMNSLLAGDYAFTRTRSCVRSDAGFEDNLALSPGFTSPFPITFTDAAQGTLHYANDGTGSATFHQLLTAHTPSLLSSGSFPVIEVQFDCTLTYAVNPDRSYTEEMVCTGTPLAGTAATTVTNTGIQQQGQIAGQMLVFSSTLPNEETVTATFPGPVILTQQQICNRSGTAVKIRRP